MISAGLKKCTLQTRSGRPVASAIRDETMLEELVARIACGGADPVEVGEQCAA